MAIMVMATVKNINKVMPAKALLFFLLAPASVIAGEWTFEPNIGLTETYTDNVELTPNKQQSSLVSQIFIGLDTDYNSRYFDFSFSGTETYAAYSHDSDVNDDFQEASLNTRLLLGDTGLQLIASSEINNISQNDADNSLADLVSGDTIQQQVHTGGIQYQANNSDFIVNSSLTYNLIETEDNIGESQGYSFDLTSQNGLSARKVFWQIEGEYDQRENNEFSGKAYNIEGKIGAITSYRFNPFIRVYDEDVKGNVQGANNSNIPSIGPGIRWLPSRHLFIDLAYNFIQEDTTATDDYISASIHWTPSERTTLKADYSQRFYGDSFGFDFSHRNRRLTNSIVYVETIEAFDRSTFVESDLGIFYCPATVDISELSPADCYAENSDINEPNDYILAGFSSISPVENNEFTLNKRLTWTSILTLRRTTFTFNAGTREREALSSGIIDTYFDVSFDINRKTSAHSDISFNARYSENTYDKENTEGSEQDDKYRVLSAVYNRTLAHSLSGFISLQYLDRESSRNDRTYQEARASINITKDF